MLTRIIAEELAELAEHPTLPQKTQDSAKNPAMIPDNFDFPTKKK